MDEKTHRDEVTKDLILLMDLDFSDEEIEEMNELMALPVIDEATYGNLRVVFLIILKIASKLQKIEERLKKLEGKK